MSAWFLNYFTHGLGLYNPPSTTAVFDRLQYAHAGGVEGLEMRVVYISVARANISCLEVSSCRPILYQWTRLFN